MFLDQQRQFHKCVRHHLDVLRASPEEDIQIGHLRSSTLRRLSLSVLRVLSRFAGCVLKLCVAPDGFVARIRLLNRRIVVRVLVIQQVQVGISTRVGFTRSRGFSRRKSVTRIREISRIGTSRGTPDLSRCKQVWSSRCCLYSRVGSFCYLFSHVLTHLNGLGLFLGYLTEKFTLVVNDRFDQIKLSLILAVNVFRSLT